MRVSDAKMNFRSILICIVSSWSLIALVGMFMSRLMLVICKWNDTLSAKYLSIMKLSIQQGYIKMNGDNGVSVVFDYNCHLFHISQKHSRC